MASALATKWKRQGGVISVREHMLNAMEAWFALPGRASAPPPPRWKMWLLSSAAIYPLITLITLLGGPVLGHLALPLRFLISTPLLGALMTWIVMPWVTKLTARWLFLAAA